MSSDPRRNRQVRFDGNFSFDRPELIVLFAFSLINIFEYSIQSDWQLSRFVSTIDPRRFCSSVDRKKTFVSLVCWSLVCKALWNYCDNNYDNAAVQSLWFTDEQLKILFSLFEESLGKKGNSFVLIFVRLCFLLKTNLCWKRRTTSNSTRSINSSGTRNTFPSLLVCTNGWSKDLNICTRILRTDSELGLVRFICFLFCFLFCFFSAESFKSIFL